MRAAVHRVYGVRETVTIYEFTLQPPEAAIRSLGGQYVTYRRMLKQRKAVVGKIVVFNLTAIAITNRERCALNMLTSHRAR